MRMVQQPQRLGLQAMNEAVVVDRIETVVKIYHVTPPYKSYCIIILLLLFIII